MQRNRFRKLSLRILLFVVLPLCALGFLVAARINTAQHQVATLRALYDSDVVVGGSFIENEVWWEAFWGGNPVSVIGMVSITGTKAELDAMAAMTSLQTLELISPIENLSPQSVRIIARRHPRLKRWSVVSGVLSSETWAAIARVSNLESLEVMECNLTDADLREFAQAPLTELRLDSCRQLTDRCCQSIGKMRNLRVLSLQSMAITDQGVQRIEALAGLEALSLHATQVAGSGLAVLSKMPRLRMLSVSMCPINAVGLQHIAGLRKLQSLDLDSVALSDRQLQTLTHMTEIQALSLRETEITNHGIRHLLRFPWLTDLDISCTRVDDEGILRLAGLHNLRTLQCYGTYTSTAALHRLRNRLFKERIQRLSIHWGGAACIDTQKCEIIGYLPFYPDDVGNGKAVAGTKQTGGRVCVFPLQIGEPFVIFPATHTKAILSDDGKRLSTVGRTDLKTYDLKSRRLLSSTTVTGTFTELIKVVDDKVISRDGNQFTARDFATGATLWTTATSSPTLRSENIAVSDTRLIISTPYGVDLIDLSTGQSARIVRQQLGRMGAEVARTHLVGITDDGRTVAAQVFDDAPIRIGDLTSSELITELDVVPDDAVMSENAAVIATYLKGQVNLALWDTMTGDVTGRVQSTVSEGRMMFTPDGRYLIVDLGAQNVF